MNDSDTNQTVNPSGLEGESPKSVLMAAMLAHEINNLMTPVLGHAQLALRHDPDPRSERALKAAIAGAEQAGAIATALLETVAPNDPLLGTTLIESIDRARLLSPLPRSISLEVHPLADVVVPGAIVTQVVINLIRNAERAIQADLGEGRIEIESVYEPMCSTWNTPAVSISIGDSGPGLDVIEPDRAIIRGQHDQGEHSAGYGLGLKICGGLLHSVGGTLVLRNREDRSGAEAILRLPCGVLDSVADAA